MTHKCEFHLLYLLAGQIKFEHALGLVGKNFVGSSPIIFTRRYRVWVCSAVSCVSFPLVSIGIGEGLNKKGQVTINKLYRILYYYQFKSVSNSFMVC